MAKLLLLWLYPGDNPDEAKDKFNVDAEALAPPDLRGAYTMRFVRTPPDLIEKVLIFDAGLSDMVIEVLKVMAAGLVPAARGAEIRFSPTQERSLAGQPLPFAVLKPGEKPGMMTLPWAHYQMVTGRFPGLLIEAEATKGKLVVVDQAFALETIKPAAGIAKP
jgi:hypothetical protein